MNSLWEQRKNFLPGHIKKKHGKIDLSARHAIPRQPDFGLLAPFSTVAVWGMFLAVLLVSRETYAQPSNTDAGPWTKTYPPRWGSDGLEFAEPEPTLSGIVVNPDGTPAHHAEVYITGPLPSLMDGNDFRYRNGMFPTTVARTGSRGEFYYPPSSGKKTIYATADTGCSLQSGIHLDDAPLRIVLEPWSRVRVVRGDGAPPWAALRTTYLWSTQDPEEGGILGLDRHYEGTRKDEAYIFSRVIPGRYSVDCRKNSGTGTSHLVAINVAPGEELTVVVGGGGRPVQGRVIIPVEIVHWVDWSRSGALLHPAEPPTVEAASGEAGSRTVHPLPTAYATSVDEQQAFRFNDVLPGFYTMKVRLPKTRNAGETPGYDLLAEVKTQVQVPDPVGDGVLELGTFPAVLMD